MSTSEPISLHNFFIYNSTLGAKEGEEEKKILFYHPPEVSLDTKIRDVGFTEAIVKFTSTFSSDESCHTMQTLKTSQFYYQAEVDFWLVLTVNAPYDTRTSEDGEHKEYKGDTIHGKIYRAVLEESYKMFRLFYGKFEESFVGDTAEERSLALMGKLEDFFSVYLKRLMVHNCDMINAFRSIQYLPLEQQLFLRIHNFANSIESMHPVIKQCVIMHKEKIIWSGLKPDLLYTFNEYLHHTLLPSINEDFLTMAVNGMTDNSRFVVGPQKCERRPISMFTYNEYGERQEFQMIVYSAKNILCCLMLDKLETEEFYAELQLSLNTQLVAISLEIDQFLRTSSNSASTSGTMSPKQGSTGMTTSSNTTSTGGNHVEALSPKFLYLNECNLRHEGTLTGKHGGLPRDLINILMDLYEERDERNISEETVVKTMNDYWLFRKNCNSRCFFVLINKYATLIEIADEANKLVREQVKDVFFD